MWKITGIVFLVGGVIGMLRMWINEQKKNEKRVESFINFLQKSVFVMKTERIKVMDYFERYLQKHGGFSHDTDYELNQMLEEIRNKLSTNMFPNGGMVWEEVFDKIGVQWHFDSEMLEIMKQAGNGFFGRSREENISFLQKSINELEILQKRMKDKNIEERKVWFPVGILGSVMLAILFL